MVKRVLRRSIVLAVAAAALHAACGDVVDQKSGGETNWLAACGSNGDCLSGTCLCGVCTTECTGDPSCTAIAGSRCAPRGSTAFASACSDAPSIPGACLARCPTSGCEGTATCLDGICVPPPLREGGLGEVGDASAPSSLDGATSDSGSCQRLSLPASLVPNCILADCTDGGCRPCSGGDVPTFTGTTAAACTDNPCNPSCFRFADGATPVTRWPTDDAGAPAAVEQEYFYQAGGCPSGGVPQWELLTYGADTPGSSQIRLRARMLQPGETASDGGDGHGDWTYDLATIGAGPADAPDECTLLGSGSCPIHLFRALGDKVGEASLTLQVTLVPSGTDHPTLNWWEVRYSCVDRRYAGTCEYGGRTWANNGTSPFGNGKIQAVGCMAGCIDGFVSLTYRDTLGLCVECTTASDCGTDEYCDQTATCGTTSPGPGRCRPLPSSCTVAGSPVCGCDGVTYDNACMAALAATGVAYQAACDDPAPCWNGEIVTTPGTGTCVCEAGVLGACLPGGG